MQLYLSSQQLRFIRVGTQNVLKLTLQRWARGLGLVTMASAPERDTRRSEVGIGPHLCKDLHLTPLLGHHSGSAAQVQERGHLAKVVTTCELGYQGTLCRRHLERANGVRMCIGGARAGVVLVPTARPC